jgi:hypothetical protein
MRASKLLALSIFGIAAIFVSAAMTFGQPGGGKKGGYKGMDAGTIFDRIANGKPSIPISDLKGYQSQSAAQYAQQKGITNGMLTRQQYIEFQEQMKAMFMKGGGGRGQFGGGGPPPSVTIIQQNPSAGPDVINQLADAEFRRRDANGDGKLNQDEMPPPLRFSLAKWDKNGDGLIDMYEYRDYFAARLTGGGGKEDTGTRGIASIIIEEEELDRKPVVFRAGKMPAGLPPWFAKLDTDGDGQVALYEWRKGGMDLDEFKEWDLNDDGFITPEEALKHLASSGAKGAASPGREASSSPDYGERLLINPRSGNGGDRPPPDFKKGKKKKGGGGQ